MTISPHELHRQTGQALKEVEAQIDEAKRAATEELGIPPERMRDSYGNWPMVQLLSAKVQCLSILTQLSKEEFDGS